MLESNLKVKNNIIYNTIGTFFYFFVNGQLQSWL